MGKQNKELVESQGTEVSTDVELGFGDELGQEDCELGRIAIGQPTSEYVKNESVKQGSFVNLSDMTILGYKEEKPLEMILVGHFKYWIESDKETRDFIGKYPATDANELPWEEMVDGRLITRTFNAAYLVLLPEEIKDGCALPYEFTFRSTEAKNAKKINSIVKKMRKQNIPAWGKVFEVTCALKSKGKDSWFATTTKVGRDTTPEEREESAQCYNEFKQFKDKAMSSEETTTEATNDFNPATQQPPHPAEQTEAMY